MDCVHAPSGGRRGLWDWVMSFTITAPRLANMVCLKLNEIVI